MAVPRTSPYYSPYSAPAAAAAWAARVRAEVRPRDAVSSLAIDCAPTPMIAKLARVRVGRRPHAAALAPQRRGGD